MKNKENHTSNSNDYYNKNINNIQIIIIIIIIITIITGTSKRGLDQRADPV